VRCTTAQVSKEVSCPLCGNYIVNFTTKSRLGQAENGTTKKEPSNLIKNRGARTEANKFSALFGVLEFHIVTPN